MSKKLQMFLRRSAYIIYGILFGAVFLSATFYNVSFEYSIVTQIVLMAFIIAVLAIAMKIYTPLQDAFYNHRHMILALVCLIIFVIQIAISTQLVPTVLYDYEKVLNGAVMYATNASREQYRVYDSYLHHYPHQVGIFMILQRIFRIASAVGYTNYFMVACFAGHLMFMIMLVTSFLYLDENISGHRALFFLGLIVMFMPLYFQSSVAYTDTYSIWCIPCLLLFATRAVKSGKISSKVMYAALSGLLLALSVKIKTTSAIIVIALLIQFFVNGSIKKNKSTLAVLLAVFILSNAAINQWVYSNVLDETRGGESMPITHWIMMGLQGDGSYSRYDEWYISSAVPADARVAKNIEVIKQRLGEMGVKGYIGLLYRKTCRTFGCGNAELYYTYLYEPESEPVNLVYEITLQNGRFYTVLNNGSQAIYLISLLLGTIGAFMIAKKKTDDISLFAPHIALVGFWIFMMLWESNHRQLINQWSLFFIVAAIGLYHVWQRIFNKSEQI